MALTYTPNGELDSIMPSFELPHVDGSHFSSQSLRKYSAQVIVFMCSHCPYVQAIEDRLIQLHETLQKLNVSLIGICSNDPSENPEDQPAQLFERWKLKNYKFPYLIDASQTVAKEFGAVCTPDFFAYDKSMKLKYRGRLDDSWRDATKVQNQELLNAVQQMIQGQNPHTQRPSMGCSIKWTKS